MFLERVVSFYKPTRGVHRILLFVRRKWKKKIGKRRRTRRTSARRFGQQGGDARRAFSFLFSPNYFSDFVMNCFISSLPVLVTMILLLGPLCDDFKVNCKYKNQIIMKKVFFLSGHNEIGSIKFEHQLSLICDAKAIRERSHPATSLVDIN